MTDNLWLLFCQSLKMALDEHYPNWYSRHQYRKGQEPQLGIWSETLVNWATYGKQFPKRQSFDFFLKKAAAFPKELTIELREKYENAARYRRESSTNHHKAPLEPHLDITIRWDRTGSLIWLAKDFFEAITLLQGDPVDKNELIIVLKQCFHHTMRLNFQNAGSKIQNIVVTIEDYVPEDFTSIKCQRLVFSLNGILRHITKIAEDNDPDWDAGPKWVIGT